MTAVAPETLVAETAPVASQFVQYLFLKVDPQWRRLDAATRAAGRAEFAEAVSTTGPTITTHAYSTLGLKTGAELMLWWKSADAVHVQDALASLLSTGLGRYCEIAHSLWGLTRPSLYTKRRTTQEQAVDEPTRMRYLTSTSATISANSTKPWIIAGTPDGWISRPARIRAPNRIDATTTRNGRNRAR